MLSLLISAIVGTAISLLCLSLELKHGTVAYGILGFIAAQILISLLVRKKTTAVNNELQQLLEKTQKRVAHKVNQFQMKPGGNPRLIQQQVERDQQEMCKTSLEFIKRFDAFKKWNLLMGKQIATMRLQFLYQLKEFELVDEIFAKGLLGGPIMTEPMLVAMKMARQYKNAKIGDAEKTYKRYSRWFRNENGAILAGLMSWIYVKQGKVEDARQLLAKAKDKSYNETLARNWEMLSNDRVKSFSNAGFGDHWYGLYLETPPKPKQQRVRMQGGKRGRGF